MEKSEQVKTLMNEPSDKTIQFEQKWSKNPTLKQDYETAVEEAQSLNIDINKVMEPTKGKWVTLKHRTEMLKKAIDEQNKILSEEVTNKISPKKTEDTKSTKVGTKAEMVSLTTEGRQKFLSDFKQNLNKKGNQ